MKAFFSSLRPAIISVVLLTVLLGIIYPLFIYGVGQVFFRRQANGSLFFYQNGIVLGSEWIGQDFTQPKYFHPRPSSAGDLGYDAAHSSGSNLGPTSQKLVAAIGERVSRYRIENNLDNEIAIPADAVTTSASGLDPHISIANALLQTPRVALERHVTQEDVKDLIEKYREKPSWGIFGEHRVNVLRLNLALDQLSVSKGTS